MTIENQLRRLFDSNLSQNEIALRLGISRTKLAYTLKELGLKRSVIRKMYQAGASGAEIADKLKVHKISVYNKIKKMNLSRPKKCAEYTSTFKGKDIELIKLRQSGLSLKQIADLFGVKPNTVFYRLKKLNQGEGYA